MNDNRSLGSNGDGTRDSRTGAEHDIARERKVTPESSMLRESASDERTGDRRPGESASEERARAQQARERQARAGREHEEHASAAQRARDEDTREGTGAWRDDDPRWHGRDADRRAQATSVTTLLRDLAGDAATLTRKEVALARAEISHAISGLKTGLISAATGGGILYAGFLLLLLSATFGLATVMAPWLAALIVGGVVAVIGLILVMTGKQKLQAENFRPDRTTDAMRKDQDMLHRRTR
jgi:hypothetical protein